MKKTIVMAAVLLCLVTAGQAAVDEYTDQATFNAAVSNMTTVDFDNEFSTYSEKNVGTYGYGPSGNQVEIVVPDQSTLYELPDNQWGNQDAAILMNGSYQMAFSFEAGGITAFSVVVSNAEDDEANPYAQLGIVVDNVESLFQLSPPSWTSSDGAFYGYIADGEITGARFYPQNNPNSSYTNAALTEISYGVPEPATLGLLSVGGLALLRRCKK